MRSPLRPASLEIPSSGVARAPTSNTITGTNLGETLTGTIANDLILGLDGKDILTGGKGRDRLFGENGNDDLIGAAGNDFLKGGAGRDVTRWMPRVLAPASSSTPPLSARGVRAMTLTRSL